VPAVLKAAIRVTSSTKCPIELMTVGWAGAAGAGAGGLSWWLWSVTLLLVTAATAPFGVGPFASLLSVLSVSVSVTLGIFRRFKGGSGKPSVSSGASAGGHGGANASNLKQVPSHWALRQKCLSAALGDG